ncbi:TPA: hypothetical protein QDZ10_003316 [Stenotrophomonas maltophilia]|nr:hypothetical protein [Stenotrophomonas maltophilia]
MKKMLWLLLAAMPMQAVASEEDPIAYKCYYCTPDEMEEVALAQGVGRHYVYDAEKLTIVGFDVFLRDEVLKAESFVAESWVQNQFLGMMSLYDPHSGEMRLYIRDVGLLAPNTEHGRRSRYIWGQDITALNPHHAQARESVRRYLTEHTELSFLDTSNSSGKLLKFHYAMNGDRPIVVAMTFKGNSDINSHTYYYFNHDGRRWTYLYSNLPQGYSHERIQEDRLDFAPSEGDTIFDYRTGNGFWAEAFIERATWANIPVHGQLPVRESVRFTCKRATDDIQCYINN